MAVDISHFIGILKHEVAQYRVPVVDLVAVQTRSPFKVLVATILSAREHAVRWLLTVTDACLPGFVLKRGSHPEKLNRSVIKAN